jgi:hypothetical protein
MKRAFAVVCVFLPGCFGSVATLQPNAKSVTVVHETDKPLHCEQLGKISGTSRSTDEKEARQGAENDFRNKAAELKGNFALIEAERGGQVGTGAEHDSYLGGRALFCQTEEMEDAQAKQEAAAREQREKDEAERAQKEADEKKEKAAEKGKKKGKT